MPALEHRGDAHPARVGHRQRDRGGPPPLRRERRDREAERPSRPSRARSAQLAAEPCSVSPPSGISSPSPHLSASADSRHPAITPAATSAARAPPRRSPSASSASASSAIETADANHVRENTRRSGPPMRSCPVNGSRVACASKLSPDELPNVEHVDEPEQAEQARDRPAAPAQLRRVPGQQVRRAGRTATPPLYQPGPLHISKWRWQPLASPVSPT